MIMCIKVLGRTGMNINEKLGIIERLKRQCCGLVGSVVLNIGFSRNVILYSHLNTIPMK